MSDSKKDISIGVQNEQLISTNTNDSVLFEFAGICVFIYFFVTVLFIVWFSFSKINNGKFISSTPQLVLWSVLVLIIIYIMSSAYVGDNKKHCADLTSKIIIIMSILGLITNVYFFQKI